MKHFQIVLILSLVSWLGAVVTLPVAAQEPTPEGGTTIIVTGAVDLSTGKIIVAGYIIAPAGAFSPTILEQGDIVIIIGTLTPNSMIIRAESLEFFATSALSN